MRLGASNLRTHRFGRGCYCDNPLCEAARAYDTPGHALLDCPRCEDVRRLCMPRLLSAWERVREAGVALSTELVDEAVDLT